MWRLSRGRKRAGRVDGATTHGDGRRPLVRLTPNEAHALLTFLRLPGVAELIEREDAARQEKTWRDYEEDPEYTGEWHADK